MRIITGRLKGREFKSPPGHKTHPMSDKVRGALFNVLGEIDGLSLIDAFAGSGAVTFEAASRGAGQIVTIEKDKAVHSHILKNLRTLQLEGSIKAVRANASGWSDTNPDRQFDIVVLDPPYNDIQLNLLQKLADRHVKPDGLAVLSLPPQTDFTLPSTVYSLLSTKSYGDARLDFYRKIER